MLMKILIIRHGDPDYEHDTVTPKGKREAELLADRLEKTDISAFYCSPLGRAKATAAPTLSRLGREAETCDWLQEFHAVIVRPDTGKPGIAWNLMPACWTAREDLYDRSAWYNDPMMKTGAVEENYRAVAQGLDGVLAVHGYERCGGYYRAVSPNTGTLAFFCHLGVGCVMLGHLLGIAPPVLWHGIFLAPTSVTQLATEEREEGKAYFRCTVLGGTEHLQAAGEETSHSGMFPETFRR